MAAICLVVPCGYPSELFDLCEVILNQVAPLLDLCIIITLEFKVGFGQEQSSCTALIKALQQPVRVKRLVREQCIK